MPEEYLYTLEHISFRSSLSLWELKMTDFDVFQIFNWLYLKTMTPRAAFDRDIQNNKKSLFKQQPIFDICLTKINILSTTFYSGNIQNCYKGSSLSGIWKKTNENIFLI